MITVSTSSPIDMQLDIPDLFNLACFLSRKTECSYFGLVLQHYEEIDSRIDSESFDPDYDYHYVVATYNGIKEKLILATEKDQDEECVTYTCILVATTLELEELREANKEVKKDDLS